MDEIGESGRTVFLVSHNMNSIGKLCNRAILLKKGKVNFIGKTSQAIQKYLDNIVDNEFIKFEAEIYHLGQLDEGFLDYIKGTYKKAKDYAVAAAKKLKKMVVKFMKMLLTDLLKMLENGLQKDLITL